MRELEEALLEQEASLHAAAAVTADLDAAMSLASVASDFGFVRPEVNHFKGVRKRISVDVSVSILSLSSTVT